MFDLIKTILIISETKIGHKADLGQSLIIHFCVFFGALEKIAFDNARLRIGILMKLSTGMLIAFSEEIIAYSEPIRTHKNHRVKGFLLPFLMLLSSWIAQFC